VYFSKKTMKTIFAILAAFALQNFSLSAQTLSGDIAFWIPFNTDDSLTNAQVIRNEEYFSIKLQSVFAYYKSGFLENIKQLVVASQIDTSGSGQAVSSAMINKSWQCLDKSGDFIGINDHLAVLAPATPTSVKLTISFRGVGEDKFKSVFDLLADPTMKTAMDFSPATMGALAIITPTVQKLLATPYTSSNPRQILDVDQSFAIYPRGTPAKPDGLREGYLVVFSGRENKSAGLEKILNLQPNQVRIGPLGQGLEYFDGTSWILFNSNSYVVFSVTKVPVRGPDESSPWFQKYQDAIDAAEKDLNTSTPKQAHDDSLGLWNEGNALLRADLNYLQSERDKIKFDRLGQLTALFAPAQSRTNTATVMIDPKELNVPSDYMSRALAYNQQLDALRSDVTVSIPTELVTANPDAVVNITQGNESSTATTAPTLTVPLDSSGSVVAHLLPGEYTFKIDGNKPVSSQVYVEPKKNVESAAWLPQNRNDIGQ
jgi:hypothetical protein